MPIPIAVRAFCKVFRRFAGKFVPRIDGLRSSDRGAVEVSVHGKGPSATRSEPAWMLLAIALRIGECTDSIQWKYQKIYFCECPSRILIFSNKIIHQALHSQSTEPMVGIGSICTPFILRENFQRSDTLEVFGVVRDQRHTMTNRAGGDPRVMKINRSSVPFSARRRSARKSVRFHDRMARRRNSGVFLPVGNGVSAPIRRFPPKEKARQRL
jgi:hypothetical protein